MLVVAEMQHSCHGLDDSKTFDILPSWQYGAILTDDESGLCLDLTPCNNNDDDDSDSSY
jgi:hypothetical protein